MKHIAEQGRNLDFSPSDFRLADVPDDGLVGDRVLRLQVCVIIYECRRIETQSLVEQSSFEAGFIGPDFLRLVWGSLAGSNIVSATLEATLGARIKKQVIRSRPFKDELRRGRIKGRRALDWCNHEPKRVWLDTITAFTYGVGEK